MQPETARVDAKVAPARVMRAQVEEPARCMSVTVEVDTEGSLLSVGQGSREAASPVQERLEPSAHAPWASLTSPAGQVAATTRQNPATLWWASGRIESR